MSRSAGPFTGRPAMIGLTPTTRSRRATSASRTPATARIGPIEITGLLGHTSTVSALEDGVDHAGRRGGGVGAVEVHADAPAVRTRSRTNHSCIASSPVVGA